MGQGVSSGMLKIWSLFGFSLTKTKTLYVADLFYIATITFIKLSILAFLHSLFAISVGFQRCNYVAIALSVVWFFVFIFLNAFQCHPVHMLWDAMGSPEYCLPSGEVWLGLEVTNTIIDFTILLLPLAMVNTLKLNLVRKCQVGGIFLLGGLYLLPFPLARQSRPN